MVAIGYQPPQKMEAVASGVDTTQAGGPQTPAQPSVDQLVATNIAAGIAERAELPIANNVANLSLSLTAESELAQSTNSIISKPTIVQPTADGREVRSYAAQAGETTQTIGQRFGISAETIRWANNLNGDAVEAGRQLKIPPVDGVLYVVKSGDTVENLASKYAADKNRIVTFNDLELGGLTAGATIIIPGGVLPANERPGYVAPRRNSFSGGSSVSSSNLPTRITLGNKYAFGNCTSYAYERRLQLGRPVGGSWGNASSWAGYARAAGYIVNNTPAVGAVMQNGGGYGHVAIVESVNSDGSITISEMNYAGNFNRVTSRTVSAGTAAGFNYIH